MAPVPTTRMVLRVRTPRRSRSSRKPRTSSAFVLRFVVCFAFADRDRGAGATGPRRAGSSVPLKVKGENVARRWKVT